MGAAHNELQWGKLLWTHLWIDHVYYFAKKWRILSKFSSFTMEGSHRRLKHMLRNSGGLSLGVQMVVDNHTIDDSLWSHGGDATKQGTKWARAHKCTKVCKPYKKTASNRHAAPSDSEAAVPVSRETDMRTQHELTPLLHVARVHAGMHWRAYLGC